MWPGPSPHGAFHVFGEGDPCAGDTVCILFQETQALRNGNPDEGDLTAGRPAGSRDAFQPKAVTSLHRLVLCQASLSSHTATPSGFSAASRRHLPWPIPGEAAGGAVSSPEPLLSPVLWGQWYQVGTGRGPSTDETFVPRAATWRTFRVSSSGRVGNRCPVRLWGRPH